MALLLAFFGALAAACCDIGTRRIPNSLVVLMWAAGAAVALAGNEGRGGELASAGFALAESAGRQMLAALGGAVLPLAVLLPLWRLKAMGAGDIKLLSGLGSLLGIETIASVFAAAVVCAALIGAGLIAEDGFSAARRAKVHFAVPVFMGILVVVGPAL